MIAILNYTTKISTDQTISEIQRMLSKRGANKIVCDYHEGEPVAVTFSLPINGTMVAFALPANYSGVLKAMRNDKKIQSRFKNESQAARVSWRIVRDWVEAQMAIVDAQLADVAEVFLPYAITKSGTTLYKEISSNPTKLLTQ